MTDDEKLVQACIRVAEQRRIADPFFVARQVKPTWTLDEWNAGRDVFEAAELERRCAAIKHSDTNFVR